jgi:hypothetical protein
MSYLKLSQNETMLSHFETIFLIVCLRSHFHPTVIMPTTAALMLQNYLDAESAILEGKSWRMPDGRMLTLEDLDKVQAGRREWERKAHEELARLSGQNARRPFQVIA